MRWMRVSYYLSYQQAKVYDRCAVVAVSLFNQYPRNVNLHRPFYKRLTYSSYRYTTYDFQLSFTFGLVTII